MTRLGKYDLHETLGSGAFADVYRATDAALKRVVALKLLKPALIGDPDAFARFMQEAQVAGGLFHPHIATVLDLGEADGRYFIAMRYVDGSALDQVIAERAPLPWDEALRLISQVAEALAYAHGRGLVHRDVKPQNILVSPIEGAVLTDFGLVRAMEASGMSTRSGAILGTPQYIPPEVWNGQPATPASDQYALGCVFFELLSGQALFSGQTPAELVTRHVVEGPKFPQNWSEIVPRGVETVLRKALSKEPAQRYASTLEFIQALKGLIPQDEPAAISISKPIRTLNHKKEKLNPDKIPAIGTKKLSGTTEKLRRIVKKNGWVSYLAMGPLLVLILAGIFQLSWNAYQQRNEDPLAAQNNEIDMAGLTLASANVLKKPITTPSQTMPIMPTLSPSSTAEPIFLPTETSGWTPTSTYFLEQTIPTISAVTPLSTSERMISPENAAQVVELARWNKSWVYDASLSPDNSYLAARSGTGIYILDAQTLDEICFIETTDASPVISPDGKILAATDRTIKLRNIPDGSLLANLGESTYTSAPITFSPDGLTLVSSSSDDIIRLWNMADGSLVQMLEESTDYYYPIAFSPEWDMLAIGFHDGTIHVWNLAEGVLVHTLQGHSSAVYKLAFSPDGHILASGSEDNTIRMWNTANGSLLYTLVGHLNDVSSLAFSPDGSILASGSGDQTIQLWNTSDGSRKHLLELPTYMVNSVAFSPDGKVLASGSSSGVIHLWSVEDGSLLRLLETYTNSAWLVAFTPDGASLISLLHSPARGRLIYIWGVPPGL